MTEQTHQEKLRIAQKAFATMGYDLGLCGKAADYIDELEKRLNDEK